MNSIFSRSPLRHWTVFLLSGILAACGPGSSTASTAANGNTTRPEATSGSAATLDSGDASTGSKAPAAQYRNVEWIDLMPQDDMEALFNPPEYLSEIVDGSSEDQIGARKPAAKASDGDGTTEQIEQQIQDAIAAASDDRYEQALVSTRIKQEFNDQAVRIPGFIVPLEFDAQNTVTQFFIVPYFGACIHVPPPPPNQTIFATYTSGVNLASMNEPFWFSGTLVTTLTEKEVATSAYSLRVDSIAPYSEETE